MKRFFISFFLLINSCSLSGSEPLYLKDKLCQGEPGDYAVIKQEKFVSLLFINSLNAETILFEEITYPSNQKIKTSWQEWIDQKAPGHTSWLMYEIDLKEKRLSECFSFSQGGWLQLDQNNQFLCKLLYLPLYTGHDDLRKKIGPEPQAGEPDLRKAWAPKITFEHEIDKAATTDYFRTKWPQDQSEISNSDIEIYFDSKQRTPFPHWIDLRSPHYTLTAQTLDAGSHLRSPHREMPRRLFEILEPIEISNDNVHIKLHAPLYYKKIELYAIDHSTTNRENISLNFSIERDFDQEIVDLKLSKKEIRRKLNLAHHYTFACLTDEPIGYYFETKQPIRIEIE